MRTARAVAALGVVAGLAVACSAGHVAPQPPSRTAQSAAQTTRTGHWDRVSFRYPATWTLQDFKIPAAGPVTLGPYLGNRPLHDPCAKTDTCEDPPVGVPVTAGTVWAQWTKSVLPTPGKPGSSRITVRDPDDGQTCPNVGAPLGSFTANWTTEPVTAYRLHACYTRTDAASLVRSLRAIAATVVIAPEDTTCSPSRWRAAASTVSPYRPGGGVEQVSARISIAVLQGQCQLPFAPSVQLINRGEAVGSASVPSPLVARTTRLVTAGEVFRFLVVWTAGNDARCRSASTATGLRIALSSSQQRALVPLPTQSSVCRLDTVYVTYPH